jgi:hypothetical protein
MQSGPCARWSTSANGSGRGQASRPALLWASEILRALSVALWKMEERGLPKFEVLVDGGTWNQLITSTASDRAPELMKLPFSFETPRSLSSFALQSPSVI